MVGVQLKATLICLVGFIVLQLGVQIDSQPLMGLCGFWVQLNGFSVALLGILQLPFVGKLNPAERNIRFRQIGIAGDCLENILSGLGIPVIILQVAVMA